MVTSTHSEAQQARPRVHLEGLGVERQDPPANQLLCHIDFEGSLVHNGQGFPVVTSLITHICTCMLASTHNNNKLFILHIKADLEKCLTATITNNDS